MLQVARNNFVKIKNLIIENEDREESVLLNNLFQELIKVCGEQHSTRLFAAPHNLNAQSIRAKRDEISLLFSPALYKLSSFTPPLILIRPFRLFTSM